MSARLMSSRAVLLKVNRPPCRQARLLELLYLVCALLLGALLAATTLSAAPLSQAHARQRDAHRQTARMSRVAHPAPRAAVAECVSE